MRGDNRMGLHMLRFVIDDPGGNHKAAHCSVYNHIMRELLGIDPGDVMEEIIVERGLRGRWDVISLKYFFMDLNCNDNYEWKILPQENSINRLVLRFR